VIRAFVAIALVSVPAVLFAQGPRDFARGVEIRTDGPGSIFRVVLPEDVYATVTRPDLSDLRVLNAAGDRVPHTLRQAPVPPSATVAPIDVHVFPLFEQAAAGSPLTQVVIGDGGAVLEVRRDRGRSQDVSAYLVDASGVDTAIDRMSLGIDGSGTTSFLARIDVQRSEDLSRWQTVVSGAAIARMQHTGYLLVQSEIELPPVRSRYFRISWPKQLSAVTLKSVALRSVAAAPVAEIRWMTTPGQTSADSSGAALYDTGARFPIEQVDMEFADATDAASVTVRSRPDPSADWRVRHVGLFYSLTEPETKLKSSPARVQRTTDRYWRIETSREGGWRQDRLPRLRLGWRPHELLFLAQGAGPYTLAYGSARVGPTDAPVDALLASLDRDEQLNRTRVATLGDVRDLGGAEALTPVRPWRRVLLWAVLIGAVLVLAVLALRIFRDPAPAQSS
jgi:Protein of unknown function (DUF3999)